MGLRTALLLVVASALYVKEEKLPPQPFGPAPYDEEKLPPQPFAYEYGVNDDYTKVNFKKTETQDAQGNVKGSFNFRATFKDPDVLPK